MLMPRIDDDPSRNRGRLDDPDTLSLLHRPMVLRESFRIYEHKVRFPKDGEWAKYILDKEFALHLAYYGRPLWGSLLEAAEGDKIAGFYRALQLIEEKFSFAPFQEVDSTMASSIAQYELALAEESRILECFGNTVYLPPLATSDHAANLVKSRYGFLASFDNLTCQYKVGFYSEPLVSLFCLRALYEGSGLKTALETLASTAAAGVFNLGVSGELIARLLLLSAVVKAGPEKVVPESYLRDFGTQWPLGYILPRRFGSVLEMLVGELPRGFKGRNKMYLDGQVVLTHWMLAEPSSLNSNICRNSLRRTAGLVMPANTGGVDLMFPLVLESGELAAIWVQVKNVKGSPGSSFGIYELMRKKAEDVNVEKAFYLIMSLKGNQVRCEEIEDRSGTQQYVHGLFIEGTRFPRLEAKLPAGVWDPLVVIGNLLRGQQDCLMHLGPYVDYAEAVEANVRFAKVMQTEANKETRLKTQYEKVKRVRRK